MNQDDIVIRVQTKHLEDHPDAEEKYAFAYRVTIANNSEESVTLQSRYWLITDGNGKKTEISGEGVVGEQPTILPGKYYQYTSGAVLDTPVGTMEGHYQFIDSHNSPFESPIPVFRLAVVRMVN